MSQILIVDDNPKNIQLLAGILTEFHHDIEYAQNGLEAVKIVKGREFDLILMDVMMPEMDGFAACKEIKKREYYKTVPIIFLTAQNDIKKIEEGFLSGGVDYVAKPFNSIELLARIKTHLTLKEVSDFMADQKKYWKKMSEKGLKNYH